MSFSSLKGQDAAIEILRRFMREGRLQGGYLLSGPEGVGKRQAALIIAKALNCLELDDDSCGRCSSCLKIDKGEHPDVHSLAGGEDEITIEMIRMLQKEMSLRPYEGKKKVFIIDNAHAMTEQAANALLKVLEEPPANSVMVLISDKPELLLKTVISRCRTVKFASLPRGDLEELLKRDYSLDEASAHFLAYFSEGRIGRALRLKDSGIMEEKNRVIDGCLTMKELDCSQREAVRGYLTILASWLRDVYILKAGIDRADVIHYDRADEVHALAAAASLEGLYGLFGSLTEGVRNLEQNVNTKLLMYTVCEEIRDVMKGKRIYG